MKLDVNPVSSTRCHLQSVRFEVRSLSPHSLTSIVHWLPCATSNHLQDLNIMGQGGLPLVSIGERLDSWSRSPLHPTLLPVGALALVHAVRVSHATRQVAGSKKCRLGLWQGFLLNQILMFGGVVVSGMLLAVPSLLLIGWPIVVLYGGVHVLLDITPGGMLLLSAQEVEFMGIL